MFYTDFLVLLNVVESWNMSSCGFGEYIDFLRDNLINLIQYKESTGTFDPNLLQLKHDLFNQDPFVVIGASVRATRVFAEKTLYH